MQHAKGAFSILGWQRIINIPYEGKAAINREKETPTLRVHLAQSIFQ